MQKGFFMLFQRNSSLEAEKFDKNSARNGFLRSSKELLNEEMQAYAVEFILNPQISWA